MSHVTCFVLVVPMKNDPKHASCVPFTGGGSPGMAAPSEEGTEDTLASFFHIAFQFNKNMSFMRGYRGFYSITPSKFDMEPENDGFKRNLLFQRLIFRFHVRFQGSCW